MSEQFALVLLILVLLATAAWYFYRATVAHKRLGVRVALAVTGFVGHLVVFFGVNQFIDNRHRMPRWFLRFINRHGDPAGVMLILAMTALVAFLVGFAIRPAADAGTTDAGQDHSGDPAVDG